MFAHLGVGPRWNISLGSLGLWQTDEGCTPLGSEPSKASLLGFYFNYLKAMESQNILKCLVGVILIGCFLCQMRELFDQFISEMKTVAVSFEMENTLEFPSFAFCDSTAFTEKIGITSNATLYNASTFNFEEEISFHLTSLRNGLTDNLTDSYEVESFPIGYNGYCTLYKFHGKHQVSGYLSN